MIDHFKLFTLPTCYKCPEVKKYLETIDLKGEIIDASTNEGFESAKKHDITSVPIVLFFDSKEAVINEAHSIEEIKKCIKNV